MSAYVLGVYNSLPSWVQTTLVKTNRLLNGLWQKMEGYSLELHIALNALILGLWITILQPIGGGNPSMRGFMLLNVLIRSQPVFNGIASDFIWGPLMALPAAFQVWMIQRGTIRNREWCATFVACVFTLIAYLLFQDNPRSTGVVMYGWVAVGQVYTMAKLIKRRIGVSP